MAQLRVREDARVTTHPGRAAPRSELGLRDIPLRDWGTIFARAVRRLPADHGTMLASAMAYASFFSIPAVLLVTVGVFTLFAGPETITSLMGHFSQVIPKQATSLLGESLHRLDEHPSTSVVLTIVGVVLAIWSTTGGMTTYMTALDLAYERKDSRSFVQRRLVALELAAVIGLAFLLVAVLLIFGPPLERLVASHAGGASGAVAWIWWVAEWPILVAGLVVAFSALLDFGPEHRHVSLRRLVTPGSLLAAAVWLGSSGAFAYYTSNFGSYNKTWGSLAAVIIMLTWLWLAAIALLLGAEVNAEAERERQRLSHPG
jgi:membrane protein